MHAYMYYLCCVYAYFLCNNVCVHIYAVLPFFFFLLKLLLGSSSIWEVSAEAWLSHQELLHIPTLGPDTLGHWKSATPAELHASCKVAGVSGEVTVTSKADGFALYQVHISWMEITLDS